MSRTLNVVRMQLVNSQTYIWIPLIILGGSLLVSLAIYGILDSSGIESPKYGGGAQAPLWYFLAVGVQALTLTFPFSQAMSVTRREFYLGTLLTAAMTAAILSVVFVIGGFIERFTNGWGLNGYFFHLDWIWASGPFGALLFYFAVAMLCFVAGFWAATIYKRFGPTWLTVVLVGIGAVLVGILWLIGLGSAWGPVFTAIAGLGAVGFATCALGLAAVLAVIAFGTLRRAVP